MNLFSEVTFLVNWYGHETIRHTHLHGDVTDINDVLQKYGNRKKIACILMENL